MDKMKQFYLINLDDWVILYGPDSKKLYEYHNIEGERMFEILKRLKVNMAEAELITYNADGTLLEEDAHETGITPETFDHALRMMIKSED